ncbi:12311_t:CDS:2 [Funneliformis caledonium]|uniref:12311_t:CDS:1 n=1 Tax=Funneliformis caledonium TaxID=1117310 RepID=A0A9N9DBJ5_9GLOM|nr:12311_t:CDS:2 [Funneliformis caledonium]
MEVDPVEESSTNNLDKGKENNLKTLTLDFETPSTHIIKFFTFISLEKFLKPNS